ncbi:MAG: DUF5681 domain-containing protein [Alphaproteobacteria bacterium]
MPERARRKNTPALRTPENRDYEVGYGKPPVQTRFQPGRSGNPHGRPRGSRAKKPDLPSPDEERMKRIILEEAYREIVVQEGERTVNIPMIQAVMRRIAVNAAQGNQRAQRMFADLVQTIENEQKAQSDELIKTAIEYKSGWELELWRRERTGETGPEPLPHPDDIYVDVRNNRVEFRGPMTQEEKATWDTFKARKQDCDASIAELQELLVNDPDNKILRDEIAHERRIRKIICQLVPD